MTFDDDASGAGDGSHHAAHGANSNWIGVPHSATPPSHKGTVLGPQRVNRRWDPQEKARITAESFEPGANVSAIARRHGVSLGLLHYWRRTARDRGAFDPIALIPMTVAEAPTSRPAAAALEIEIGDVRIHVRAMVDGGMLRVVLDALRAR